MASGATEPVGWYISHQTGDSDGPLSDAEMRQAIARGRVKPDDYVWRQGMDGWVEAREIPNFNEVRREFRLDAQSAPREVQPKHERKHPKSSGKQHRSARKSQTAGAQMPPPPQATRRVEELASEKAQKPPSPHSLEDWLRKIGKGKPGSEITRELNDKLAKTSAKLGKLPPAALAFLVLGMFMMPLLPVFWFIAWKIWANANKTASP